VSTQQDIAVADFVSAELAAAGHPSCLLTADERDTVYYALLRHDDAVVTTVLAANRARLAAGPPLSAQCLRHSDCYRAAAHNAATRAAFDAAGYTDFTGGAA
jgi:hypothetical protein